MAEPDTKPEVTAAHASKRVRRMAKSDIFSGITRTTAATIGTKTPPTTASLVGAMLIKNKDREEYNPDETSAMMDKEGDKLTDTEAKEVPKVAKMLKRVLSKNKENEKPPDGEGGVVNGDNAEDVKVQPKLSRLLKRVLKDSRGSTEHDGTAENTAADSQKEEDTIELTPSAKGVLVRALRKRAESRKMKAAAADESSNRENGDDNTEEIKVQAQPKLSRLLKRVLKDSRGSTEHDGNVEEASVEANNKDDSQKDEESIELTPSAKGVLVRALRKRAESRKMKAAAADESSNKEKGDEGKRESEDDSQTNSEAQVQPKFGKLLQRVLVAKKESEDHQDGNRAADGGEEKGDGITREEKVTAEEETFELNPSTKGLLVRALRNRAESRKKATTADGDVNEEKADEANSGNQGQSGKQVQPKFGKLLQRVLVAKRESEDHQDEDRAAEGGEEKGEETMSEQETIELTPSAKGVLVRALRKRAESRKMKAAAADESSNKDNVAEADNEESQQEGEGQPQGQSENQTQPTFARVLKRMLATDRESQDEDKRDDGKDTNGEKDEKEDDGVVLTPSVRGLLVKTLRAKAEAKKKAAAEKDEESQGDVDTNQTESENKTTVNRMVKRAFSKNKKRQESQSASSQDEGFSNIVQRSIDLQDKEMGKTETGGEQQDKPGVEQESTLEDTTAPMTVLDEEKGSETKADIIQPVTGMAEIKAKEANGEGVETAEVAEEKTANGDDGAQVSTSDSEPGRCSGACVII